MKALLCAVALAVFLAPARAAYLDSNQAVSAATQMNGGGCYPTAKHPQLTDQLVLINPEWAAIEVGAHTPPDADPITLHGTVTLAKINEGCYFSGNHLTDDQNTFLDVDPADMGFVATGNVGPQGEEDGQLEFELEIGSYPLFAWAGTGDRMTTVGRWIWDCGHGNPDPEGTCSSTTSQVCALDSDCAPRACAGCISGDTLVGTVFNYPSQLPPPQAVPLRRPRGPRAGTTFVDGSPPHVHAIVDMTSPVRGRLPSTVGKTIFTGWRRDQTPVTRLLVHLTAIEILNPLKPVAPAMDEKKRCSVTTAQDCSATPCPRGEKCLTLGGPIPGWELFFETNGDWQRLAHLEAVMAPRTIAEDVRFDTALPSSGTLRLHGSGHSLDCREGQLYGTSLRRTLQLYGFDDGPKCLQADSHDIGAFEVSFGGPDFGSGGGSPSSRTSSVGGAGGSCSATLSRLCLGDDACPSGETCVGTGGADPPD